MNKTAMQELTENYFKLETIDAFIYWFSVNGEKLLEKEKEQIIDAHLNGQSDHHFSLESRMAESEEYYNQTYKQ